MCGFCFDGCFRIGVGGFFLEGVVISVAGERVVAWAVQEKSSGTFNCVEICFSITMSFLQTEVAEDPEKVSTVHLQLGLPLVFILSQKETYEADRRTAEFVAWQLLGKAGVALLSRYLLSGVLGVLLGFCDISELGYPTARTIISGLIHICMRSSKTRLYPVRG